ncbi:MAG: tRNA (N(6)-L-threonylcarbamoyladenosine(37)-C(2))-methylthiotransferase MtaB [Defluviitaleaceae bacterium]|nr:tRNA (N(6)-L-threonylcarbamoyladenosine(37)-C(2))-methylthiotransferase MtaB [Defluviitaleaceae bacterium]
MTVAAFTLGCKVNQYDTETILQDFSAGGFNIVEFIDIADVYIINTCTVTNVSDKKSRQMISRAYKQNPQALIVVYGCYAQVNPEALQKLEGVSMVLGTQYKDSLVEMVTSHFETSFNLSVKPRLDEYETQKISSCIKTVTKRTRAYLKIQDGCDRYCSYCIVPYARGLVKSRPIADLLSEAENLVKLGCKEIVLTGIQIAAYGNDVSNDNNLLIDLIKQIHDIHGLERLRLGSLDPNIINEKFLNAIVSLPKLCDHFHLSLQSGCDRTLSRMNRKYTSDQYAQKAKKLRSLFPKGTFTTDIIVGFPGETEEDFAQSLKFVEEINFFRIHVFMYSPKEKTPAAEYKNQIDKKTKEHRSHAMRTLGKQMNHDFCIKYIGDVLPVLFESRVDSSKAKTDTVWEGHTTQYITVRVHSNMQNLENQIIPVRLKELKDGVMYGEVEAI